MITAEQILNNNTIDEGVKIIITSAEQYKEFMTFLDSCHYVWRGTRKRPVDHCPFGCLEELEEGLQCALMLITLHQDKTITYGNFFTENHFNRGYFCDSCQTFFTEKDVLFKPYTYLKREIAQYTGIEEW